MPDRSEANDCDRNWAKSKHDVAPIQHLKKPAARLFFNRSIIPLEQAFLANKQGSEKGHQMINPSKQLYILCAASSESFLLLVPSRQTSQGGEGLASSM